MGSTVRGGWGVGEVAPCTAMQYSDGVTAPPGNRRLQSRNMHDGGGGRQRRRGWPVIGQGTRGDWKSGLRPRDKGLEMGQGEEAGDAQ